MIKAIISYLKSDSELINLLGISQDNPKIYPFEHSDNEDAPFIVYTISPVLAGDVITQYRCELRIVANDIYQVESITKSLMRLMHFRRKSGFISYDTTIYNSSHVGGGLLKNPDTKKLEQLLIFNVKSN